MPETLHCMVGGNTFFRDIGCSKDEAQTLQRRGDLVIQIGKAIAKLGISYAQTPSSRALRFRVLTT